MQYVLALACGLVLAVGAVPAAGRDGGGQAAQFPSAFDPAWSPDGRQIVYVTDADGDYEIAVMKSDGTARRVLTKNRSADRYPDWMPDGRHIVFTSDRDGDAEIYSMRADGTDVVQLTANDALDRMPDVSPDGTQIVFSSDRVADAWCQIFVMDIGGQDVRRLVADDGDDHAPAWSPDGRRVAFEGGDDNAVIEVVNADGSGHVRLTEGGEESDPAWTPDGRIAFDSDGELAIMNQDGTGAQTIAATRGDEYRPSVSPDGRRLAFESDADGYFQVYVSLLDGTGARRLTGPPRAFASTGDRCTIVGTPRADVLTGTSRGDVICGLGGDDRIDGAGADDIVDGGPGADRITGGRDEDMLLGGTGADLLFASDSRRDHVDGGRGRDRARIDSDDWISSVESLMR
jgi:TolB protein